MTVLAPDVVNRIRPRERNLDALARLTERGAGLDVGIAWARVRPTAGPTRQFRFSRDMARVLQEAAVEFRKNEPKLDGKVEGFVIHLDRPPESFDGQAILRVLLDGRPRGVRVRFEPSEYRQVLKAHDERVPVSLDGDIYNRPASRSCRLVSDHDLCETVVYLDCTNAIPATFSEAGGDRIPTRHMARLPIQSTILFLDPLLRLTFGTPCGPEGEQ